MIALLRGKIVLRESRAVVIDVSGVGYRVHVGRNILSKPENEEIEVYTHLHVGSDTLVLYGFETPDELGLFLSLLRVSGVGPRSALMILSEIPAHELRQAIINSDTIPLTRVSGIGKKTADRIILELSGTLVEQKTVGGDEALDALERLGYTRREASDALHHVDRSIMDVKDRIRSALQTLSKHR